jgi:hypothetical protein
MIRTYYYRILHGTKGYSAKTNSEVFIPDFRCSEHKVNPSGKPVANKRIFKLKTQWFIMNS